MQQENLLDHRQQNKRIKASLKKSIGGLFPIKSGGKRLEVSNLQLIDNLSETDFPAQKQTRLERGTWEMPIKADIKIIDDSNDRVISQKKGVKIGAVPKLTNRFSAIVKGNEYQVSNQIRRKPGVFSRKKKNGQLESEFNLQKGANFALQIDPQKQLFYFTLKSGTRRYHLYNLLTSMGMSDSKIKEAWGDKLFEKNKKRALNTEASELGDLHKKLVGGKTPDSMTKVREDLSEYFNDTSMDPNVNKITLGSSYDKASADAMLDASTKLLKINKGEEKPDERDSLIFKQLYAPDDLLGEYFKGNKETIRRKMQNSLKNREKVREVVSANAFTKPIRSFFTTSDLSSTPPQTNPVTMAVNARKTTAMGEGGIQSEHAITMETRDVHPSSFGFLDALSTPEGPKIGVNIGLASEVEKRGNDMVTPVILPNGKRDYKSPIEIHNSTIGFPDQFKYVNGKPKAIKDVVKAMKQNKPVKVPNEEIDFWFRSPQSLFDFGSNLVPFLQNTQGNRGSTAARMITQALPLDNPDTPNSVSLREGEKAGKDTYEDLMGSYLLPTLDQETGDPKGKGTVTKVGDDYIHIKTDKGKNVKVGLYNDFPLNQDGYLNTKPVVKKGDKVTGDELLAKSNYTDETGRLAIGKNLNVAYLSYKGNSFEDGATITESAAEKLSHTTIDRRNLFYNPKESILDKKKFRSYYPDELEPSNLDKLDERGLPKIGEEFKEGEALAAFLIKKEVDNLDKSLKKLNRAIYTPYSKKVEIWDEDSIGKVVDVRIAGRNIDIYVKSTHKFKEGDKLSSRYGDKHIIGKIIPDEEAPHRPDGTPVDIMVNPQGVQGRMNMGQLLDTAAGKIAKKTGEPFEVKNFGDPDDDTAAAIKKKLEELGIESNERLRDGKNGDYLENPVFVGNRQYLKLRHLVKKKQAAHSFGTYDIDEQPAGKGAQKMGVLDTYSYLAHGAKNLLREATTIKGQKNEEYFRNLQFGLPPSKPKSPMVFDKLMNYLKVAGVDVDKKGNEMQLIPLTDKKVEELSKGEIPQPGHMLIGKNLASKKGGLFDKEITGGQQGENYNHISLPKRMPNPMSERAIKSILGLTNKQYNAIMAGKENLNEDTGAEAIISALENVNVQEELKKTKKELENAPKTNVNKLNTKVRILDALDRKGMDAKEAYTMSKVLVIPPKFRPIYPLPSGDLQVSDINKHYRDVGLKAHGLRDALKEETLTDEDEVDYTNKLYYSLKAMQGFVDPITYGKQKYKGALKDLGETKKGLIFGKNWSKRQDLSGRSTIVVEPSFGIDEIGIPKAMAKEVMKPFVVRKLKQSGMSAGGALKEVKEDTDLANRTLLKVMEEKPIVLNRAPSLHKHSVQAFKGKIVDGKEIRLNPLVVNGFNADFDGDEQINNVLIFLLDQDLNNYYLDHDKYNKQYWNNRKIMASRLNVKLPYIEGGSFYLTNLEDFPYKEEKMIGQKDHIDFYEAEEYIKVIAYDEEENKLVLADASGWSYHKQQEIWTVDLSDGSQIITDDDPRAVYAIDSKTLKMGRYTPSEAKKSNVLVPKSDYYDKSIKDNPSKLFSRGQGKLKNKIKLNEDVGYIIGSIIGDGWVDEGDRPNRVNLANTEIECFNKYKNSLKSIFKKAPHIGHIISEDSYGKSEKRVISSVDFAEWMLPLVGKGSKNKHLPPFWFAAPEEFKWGLLSGLMDTDGSISVSHGKKKPQLQSNISSISLRLLQETQQMLKTLGIRSRISFSKKTQADNDFWILSISAPDLKLNKDNLSIAHQKNIDALEKTAVSQNSKSAMRNDYVPFNGDIFDYVKSTEKGFYKKYKSLYTIMSRDRKKGKITRHTAKKIIELPKVNIDELPGEWVDIVKNKDVSWVSIEKIENTGKKEDGYDLTVPGYETFMSVDGIVLSNTMSVQVPVTYEGEQDAKSMFPSKILFKHGDNALVPELSQEYIYGMSKISRLGRNTGKSFDSIREAKKADLKMTDVFTINGKKMTLGQHEINKVLPKKYQDYQREFKRQELNDLLEKIAKNEDSDTFAKIINHYKDVGALYQYKFGATVSIDDMVFDRSYRQKLVDKYKPRIEKLDDEKDKIDAYIKLTDEIEKAQNKFLEGKNRMIDLVESGAVSGSKAGNIRQVLSAPGIVSDTSGNPMPIPILKSYSEGLDTFDYFNTLPGVRKGVVDKSVNTQKSGALNKQLLAVNRRQLIVEDDCGTTEGKTYSVDNKNIMDRCALNSIPGVVKRNQLIDGDVISSAKSKNIDQMEVRTPLKCESANGICQKCYGALPNGQLPSVGTNVGVLESQALTERSTQLTLSTFHIGGAVSSGDSVVGSFPRLEQLVKVPQRLSGKATLANKNGTVKKVEKNEIGGWDVKVGGKNFTIEPGRKPVVEEGDKVRKGERLSDGIIKPQELGKLKSHFDAQNYIVDEISSVFDGAFHDKTIETVVRGISDNAQVTDAPEDSNFYKGDKSSVSYLKHLNKKRELEDQEPINFKPYFKSIDTLNVDAPDWFTKITTNRVKAGLSKGVAKMQWTDIAGKDPIPAYIFGEDFGQPEKKGKPKGEDEGGFF